VIALFPYRINMPSKQTSLELLKGFPLLCAVEVTPLRLTLPHALTELLTAVALAVVDAWALAPGKMRASVPSAAMASNPPGRRSCVRIRRRASVRGPDMSI
jgi:hypothetical protein